ncbi:MAG: radical SAM protein, partial [Negativicutes bacterium]|nr:radical SAM protein [Negativicutes bacterium]
SNCVHCWFNSNPKLRNRDGIKFMKPDLLRRIIDEVAEHKIAKPLIRITGSGEPFLMPQLTELLAYACAEKGVRAAIITNGSLLKPERVKKLMDVGIEAIEISIDAADKVSYERIRRGLKFDIIMRNIEYMMEYRSKSKTSTKILVSFVENQSEIDCDKVEMFWRQRVDNVIRRKYLTYGQISGEGYSKETYLPSDERVPCPYPFERMVVLASGNVTFCNFDVADGYYMGNLYEESIERIWRGIKYEEWRKLVLNGQFEKVPLCAKCDDWKYKSWTHNFFKVLDEAEVVK